MCGIAGKICFEENKIDEKDLALLQEKILHRGPDDNGIYISEDKKVGLVQTRLSIVDLSPKGHQPMTYKDRYVIVFNGEIYNFKGEKRNLTKLGYKFKSNTDTEVILALYDHFGVKCLEYLRGMFAFVIYDKREQKIFAARDRVGKKPLKFYLNSKTFIFASELKAILTQPEVVSRPDESAVEAYLQFGYVPAPLTGFWGIYKLEPAHYLMIDLKKKQFKKVRYWDLDMSKKMKLPEIKWVEVINNKLEECVKLRMEADVPIGVLLSGGVDSSLITALMAKNSKKPVKTFTVRYANKFADEGEFAKIIAKKFKTSHTELEVEPQKAELLPELVYMFEEPLADSSTLVSYLISKLTKQFVTVALNGDGGDENFAGYDRDRRLVRDVVAYRFRNELKLIRPITMGLHKKANKYLSSIEVHPLDKFIGYVSYFPNETAEIMRGKADRCQSEFISDKALYADIVQYLPDDLLAKSDISGMAVALEYRSPFLDHEFMELAAKVPIDLKVKAGACKYILKRAAEEYIPTENIYRKKMGFSLPLGEWFTKDLNNYARKLLLAKKAYVATWFDQKEIETMLDEHSMETDYGMRLWSLLILELWYQKFF